MIKKSGSKRTLKELFMENRFAFLAFFCSALITVLVFYCFDMVPFGDKTILRMDLYHQYGPLFAELYERVKSGSSLIYSWNTGFGGTFTGNLFNYLASPLWFLTLFFKHKDLPDAIALMILLKSAFAAGFFTYYLRKSQDRNDHTTAAFGVLYSFCGFFIAYYWNVMWIDAMALFPLVMLGLEQIIKNRKFLLYSLSLAVIMISNYYMAMMVCIFSVLYFLVYYASNYKLGEKLDDKKLKFNLFNLRFISSGVTFAGASVLSALLALFALLPTVFILRNCSATSGTFPQEMKIYYTIFDFLANHLASLEPTIRSSGNDVLPNVYCGVLTVMLVPLYLLSHSIKLKDKIAHVLLLAILFFSFNINYANYVWHGFHFPNDLPYRFSFMYSFLLLVLAYRALIRIKEYTTREILMVGLGVIGFIVVAQKVGSKNVGDNTVLVSLAFAFIYTLVLYAMHNKKFQAASVSLLLLCCVISESAIANTDHYSINQTKTSYAGDYEDFAHVKGLLDAYHGNKMYRMELTNLRTRMDPAWYNYYGLSTFSSMAPEKLSNLQSHLGIYGNFINSFTYNPQTPVYNAIMGLSYVVKKNDYQGLDNEELYTPCVSNSVYTAYTNNFSLPVAFCVGDTVKFWNHTESNPFGVQSDFMRRAVNVENIFMPMVVTDVYCNNINTLYEEDVLSGHLDATKTVGGSYGSFTVTIAPTEKQNCYLYVKSSAVDTIYVNGDDLSLTQNIDEAYILDLGILDAGEEAEVEIPLKDDADYASVTFYAVGLDMDQFIDGYNALIPGHLQIKAFTERHIEGTVTAADRQILYTSIPYDTNWHITIDGVRVPTEEYLRIGDALMAVPIEKGNHTVTFDYEPTLLYLCSAVSAVTAILLILAIVLVLRKRKKEEKIYETPEVLALEEDGQPVALPGAFAFTEEFQAELDSEELSEDNSSEEPTMSEEEAVTEDSEAFFEASVEDTGDSE